MMHLAPQPPVIPDCAPEAYLRVIFGMSRPLLQELHAQVGSMTLERVLLGVILRYTGQGNAGSSECIIVEAVAPVLVGLAVITDEATAQQIQLTDAHYNIMHLCVQSAIHALLAARVKSPGLPGVQA